jgi:uncharacterized protein YwgA
LGYSRIHVHRIIEELINTGIIRRVKRGVYEYGHKNAKLEKKRVIESKQLTLQQVVEFVKETKAKVVHDAGTLALEYETDYEIKRVIISSIIVEDNYIFEKTPRGEKIYKLPRHKLRQLLSQYNT